MRQPRDARAPAFTILAAALLLLAGVTVGQPARGQNVPTGVLGGPLASLNESGLGWFYYGLNAADRGLGYNGSYMTLGGFIPYGEDDLGGLWAADLRSHLSVNGGFFSNVGAVRKQFIGGTLFGVGVYWDYDGDLNQYPVWGQPGTGTFGQFGHVYNQVGISTEWLTDYGNLRSNGYIPVGTTAHTVGAPGYGFVGNNLLCQYGLDAALTGADLEVGAYIPGLADWAGMVSVGGYALGNSRYDWQQGSQTGQEVVPWFGGVYTRLDMTFVDNWDFSLQANNDSYFDWTGFARLTYRMGGSRRRNVPDQVEQPMMRNEHIVRAHQTPLVAINPTTNQPWRVFHVDNSAVPGGDGTAEAPLQLMNVAQSQANLPYDVVFVRRGNGNPYLSGPTAAGFTFGNVNQVLVGEGSTLELNTATCGYRRFFDRNVSGTVVSDSYPILTAGGTAITLRDGAVVDHFAIRSTSTETVVTGIAATGSLPGGAGVNDVQMVGANGAGQAGIRLTNVSGGPLNFFNMSVVDMGAGLTVSGGSPTAAFQGTLASTNAAVPLIDVQNTTGGSVRVNTTAETFQTVNPQTRNTVFRAPYQITAANTGGTAAVNVAGAAGPVELGTLALAPAGTASALRVVNSGSVVIRGAGSTVASQSTTAPAILVNNSGIDLPFSQVSSAVPAGTNGAISLTGTSTGSLTISDQFLVANPAPPPAVVNGTVAADVTNTTTGPVVVTVP
jgi:hypothetical protein